MSVCFEKYCIIFDKIIQDTLLFDDIFGEARLAQLMSYVEKPHGHR